MNVSPHLDDQPFLQHTEMRILDLPYDVWTIILQLAPRRDVFHLAKACRMTYDIALPSLLSEVDLHSHFHDLMVLNIAGVVHVHNEDLLAIPSGPEKVTSFSKFILKNQGRDAQHIRTLTIRDTAFNHRPEGSSPPKKDHSPCALLVDAIVHARNLRHIHIERLESLVENTSSLATVISGYQQLESIAFEAVGRFSLSILRNLRSTPRSIKLREAGTLALVDILKSLETCTGSLEELTLINYADATLDGCTTVWERVHTLDLVPSHPSPLSPLPALVRAFPSVRIARLGNFDGGHGVPEWMAQLLPADWGTAKPHTPSTQDSLAVRWPNLDSLKVYAPLPLLIPPVRRLLYHQTIGVHESVRDVARALGAIGRMAPVVLSVSVRGLPDAYLEGLPRSMETVRFFQLSQDFSPADHEKLKEHLSSLLRPILESANLPPLLGMSIAHIHRWPETVQERDLFRETAAAIVRRCPSMRFVGFYRSTRYVSHEDMRWYRVRAQSDEDSPIVEAVPPFQVPAVVSYLESLDRSVE